MAMDRIFLGIRSDRILIKWIWTFIIGFEMSSNLKNNIRCGFESNSKFIYRVCTTESVYINY